MEGVAGACQGLEPGRGGGGGDLREGGGLRAGQLRV